MFNNVQLSSDRKFPQSIISPDWIRNRVWISWMGKYSGSAINPDVVLLQVHKLVVFLVVGSNRVSLYKVQLLSKLLQLNKLAVYYSWVGSWWQWRRRWQLRYIYTLYTLSRIPHYPWNTCVVHHPDATCTASVLCYRTLYPHTESYMDTCGVETPEICYTAHVHIRTGYTELHLPISERFIQVLQSKSSKPI